MSVVAKPLIDLNHFGMNGYKILKCFRKEKHVSGELPYPATGLIGFNFLFRKQISFILFIRASEMVVTKLAEKVQTFKV